MQPEDLADAVAQPVVVGVEGREPADVDGSEVARRLALDDPLGQRSPRSPAEAMPTELKPAPTKNPATPGTSPRRNWLSGVKLSGPL